MTTKRFLLRQIKETLGLENLILNIGLDDSNHGDKHGEIIVAIFSLYPEDREIKRFSKKRCNTKELEIWSRCFLRDYLFTLLIGDHFRRRGNNIPYVTPFLIEKFFKKYVKLKKLISGINIYIDGEVSAYKIISLKKQIKNILNDMDDKNILVKNFVKRKGVHKCPKVIYIADLMARNLYREYSLEKLLNHSKYVSYLS